MQERSAERLSAFMDGDPDAGTECVDMLVRDAQARAAWARYHAIGDALRGQLTGGADAGFAARVSERIAGEPAVLAPRRRRAAALLKPLAGLAVAASVATVAVLGVQRLDQDRAGGAQLAANEPTPVFAPAPTPAAAPAAAPATAPVAVVRLEPADRVAAARMNSYLLNYSERRSNMAMPGMLPPYVRLIGHEGE